LVLTAAFGYATTAAAQGTADAKDASSDTEGFLLRLTPHLGWTAWWDEFDTPVTTAITNTDIYAPNFGADVRVTPYQDLVLDLAFDYAGVSIDTGATTPATTDAAWIAARFSGGWQFDLEAGPIRKAIARIGYGWDRFGSQRERPVQLTPSWTHHEPRLGGEVEAGLLGDAITAQAGLDLIVPVIVSEEFETNGTDAMGFGFDLNARALYDLGPLLGKMGNILVGAQLGWGSRWVSFDGAGSRVSPDTGEAVHDVSESLHRFTAALLVTWQFPGHGAGIASNDDEEDAEVVGKQILIRSRVLFKTGSAELDRAGSNRALRSIAKLLEQNDALEKVEVRGHTDGRGDAKTNQQLSQKRAESVVKALVELGIDEDRLTAIGLGDKEPIASNDTEAGRAKNRRVEFHVVE